jgi:hypothetical protein
MILTRSFLKGEKISLLPSCIYWKESGDPMSKQIMVSPYNYAEGHWHLGPDLLPIEAFLNDSTVFSIVTVHLTVLLFKV